LLCPKFDRYVSATRRLQFLANLIAVATLVQVTVNITACRDPKDDKFLELAANGNVECIITGDKDLLILHPFRDIAILTPQAFWFYLSTSN